MRKQEIKNCKKSHDHPVSSPIEVPDEDPVGVIDDPCSIKRYRNHNDVSQLNKPDNCPVGCPVSSVHISLSVSRIVIIVADGLRSLLPVFIALFLLRFCHSEQTPINAVPRL